MRDCFYIYLFTYDYLWSCPLFWGGYINQLSALLKITNLLAFWWSGIQRGLVEQGRRTVQLVENFVPKMATSGITHVWLLHLLSLDPMVYLICLTQSSWSWVHFDLLHIFHWILFFLPRTCRDTSTFLLDHPGIPTVVSYLKLELLSCFMIGVIFLRHS